MDLKNYDQIYLGMRNYVLAHQDQVTDFSDGSAISSILEALSREIAALYLKVVANTEIHTKAIAYSQFNFTKKGGLPASGTVIFSRPAALTIDATIPEGTQVATAAGECFTTIGEARIFAGTTETAPVYAVCTAVGGAGNVRANTIDAIQSTVPGVDAVRNSAPFVGGVDAESEADYQSRFREFILGLGRSSIPGIRSAALAVNGVRSVSIVEHFPSEDGYNFTVYAEDGSGSLPEGTRGLISIAVDGNADAPGARACGITSRIMAPSIITVNVSILIRIDWSIPRGLIEGQIQTKISTYMNALKIGETFDRQVLYGILMTQPGVLEIQALTPATIEPTDREIARLGTLAMESV